MSFTDTGAGYQIPQDVNSDATAYAFMARRLIAKLQTMTLCQVVAVRTGGGGAVAAPGTVDVQLLVNQIDGADPPNATPRGLVTNVPWTRVAGGQNAVICDPQVNDIGYIVAADRDISVVKTTFAQANPGSRRSYRYSDGVYTSMALNVTPNQYLVFTSAGVRLVDNNGNSVSMSSSGVVANSPTAINLQVGGSTVLQVTQSGIMVTGSIGSTGQMTGGGGITLTTHTHGGVSTGDSETGPPVG